MLPKLKFPGRRSSSESTKPFAYRLENLSRDGETLPTTAAPPAPARPPVTRPTTPLHRTLRVILPFARNFTLPLPVALVIVIAFVHIGAVMPSWIDVNRDKGGPTTETWLPFWVAVPYSIAYIAWWYVVWANNRKARRHSQPFLPRILHVSVESFLLVANVVCFAFMTILAPRGEAQFIVGFAYVSTMAGLLGMQMIFATCTLIGLLYECRMELAYPGSGTNHV